MKVQQISIFLENRAGRLSAVVGLIGKAGINIRALTLADTSDFGILRLIVDRPEDAQKVLKENNCTFNVTEVVAIEIADKPGGLAEVLDILSGRNVNVEYMYAFVEKVGTGAIVIFRFENIDKVLVDLKAAGVRIMRRDGVLRL